MRMIWRATRTWRITAEVRHEAAAVQIQAPCVLPLRAFCPARHIRDTLYRLYGNRWFTYAKNPRVRAQKQNVVPGDILDRSGVVLATSSVSEDGTVTRIYQANEAARRAVVHLLGDSDGQVANGVESFQTAYLYGFQTGIWERIQALVTGQKRHGDNVTLTVDSSLCTSILQSFQRRAPGKAGAAVVMNYKTGEVLGMVSLPTFDPMRSSAVSTSSNAYWNRVTQNPYTPGSTFKLVTAAAQLRVNPSAQTMQVNCTGNLTVDGQVIHDYGSASHGAIDLKTAFMRSCNNAFAQYALSMGDKALRERRNPLALTTTSFSAISS